MSHADIINALTQHYVCLLEVVRRRFGCLVFAQDVMQDVCVRLIERQHPDTIRYPIAFLRKISHDIAVDRCRKQDARNAWLDIMADLPEEACNAPTQFQILAARQTFDCLVEAIQTLPPRCQQVFVMHKIHEIPQAEVAIALGITKKTVEKHLKLGLCACHQHLLNALGGNVLL